MGDFFLTSFRLVFGVLRDKRVGRVDGIFGHEKGRCTKVTNVCYKDLSPSHTGFSPSILDLTARNSLNSKRHNYQNSKTIVNSVLRDPRSTYLLNRDPTI